MITFGTFTFGDALLEALELALLVMWIWVAIGVVLDVFRSHDLSGLAKASWILLIVIFPLVGVLFYLLFRGEGMHERSLRAASAQQEAVRQYVRGAAASTTDDLHALSELHSRGVLTDDEFERAKAKVLS
jgi:predicted membrane channel-forming protein YqfA (hemolysin III family)